MEHYRKADPKTQYAVIALLKGEKPYMTIAAALFSKLLQGFTQNPPSPIAGIVKNVMTYMDGSNTGSENPMSGIMAGVMSITGSVKNMKAAFKQAKAEKAASCPETAKECPDPANPKKAVLPKDAKTISQPLLAFTFFYSVAIYILLLSFYFWLWRTDIKPEK